MRKRIRKRAEASSLNVLKRTVDVQTEESTIGIGSRARCMINSVFAFKKTNSNVETCLGSSHNDTNRNEIDVNVSDNNMDSIKNTKICNTKLKDADNKNTEVEVISFFINMQNSKENISHVPGRVKFF